MYEQEREKEKERKKKKIKEKRKSNEKDVYLQLLSPPPTVCVNALMYV